MPEEKTYPLVIVFYIERSMPREIIEQLAESINKIIEVKGFNAIALFLPTDGEERVECINPVTVDQKKMEKIDELLKDIAKNFGLDQKLDDLDLNEEK